MDWRVSTVVGIVLVVAVGFAWFERSRPSSRVVAIVAALTALAVAGRLVFTPIPNVVATTDVAFITGFALGGPPGFAVGALAAPISNIWLGQGPWTIWQMAGWGLAGLAGAGLARLTVRRMGRLGLALACGAMGFAYGALLDLSVMVTYGGEQSLDRYLALSARGIPFNVAHAIGNFAIAFAAGPALVRMISRYRERLQFTWHPAGALPAAIALAVAMTGFAGVPEARAGVPEARSYLAGSQNADGGFSHTPGQASSASMTTWVSLGLISAGANPQDVRRDGKSPIDYLRDARVTSTTDLERTILVIEGAGLNSRSFGGRDLVAELRSKRQSDGSWENQVNITAFGILALRSAGQGDVGQSAAWLRGAQNQNGGWGFAPGRGSDADSTGAVLQALASAGGSASAVRAGSDYLARSQARDGGWTLSGGVVNSQSTAWALQGLVAAGGEGSAVSKGSSYLGKRQASDGHYRYSASADQTPMWVTSQAVQAIARKPFPLAAVPRAPASERDSDGDGTPDSEDETPGSGPGGKKRDGEGGDKKNAKQRDSKGGNDAAKQDDAPGSVPGTVPGTSDEAILAEEAAAESSEASGGEKAAIVLGALALAIAGGFLWHRRTMG